VLSIAGWEMGYEPARENIHFFVLTFLVVMFLLVFGLDGNACSFKTRKQYVNYFRTCSRSAIPILATAVIVIGSVTGIILDRGEKRASREAVVFNLNEFDLCDMGRLRDRYADQHSTFLGEYVRNFTR